jgi:TonB family protein
MDKCTATPGRMAALKQSIKAYALPLACALTIHGSALALLGLTPGLWTCSRPGAHGYAVRNGSQTLKIRSISESPPEGRLNIDGDQTALLSKSTIRESSRDSGIEFANESPSGFRSAPDEKKSDEGIGHGRPGTEVENAGDLRGPETESSSPMLRKKIDPGYPRISREAGREGTVRIEAIVDEHGAVSSASIEESSGSYLLDRAALDAVLGASFYPATRGGKPVPGEAAITVTFRLTDSPP